MATVSSPQLTWLVFALMTVGCWGLYGIMLHSGVMAFEPRVDPTARYKAFLFVGIAYFITAVLAPLAILLVKGASWEFLTNGKGLTWSLMAGVVGAAGAFCVLLAFGAKGSPAAVMSIIFAGAPVVNAIVAITMANQWSKVNPAFLIGILLAAVGGCMVTYFKPASHGPPPPKQVQPESPSAAATVDADTDQLQT